MRKNLMQIGRRIWFRFFDSKRTTFSCESTKSENRLEKMANQEGIRNHLQNSQLPDSRQVELSVLSMEYQNFHKIVSEHTDAGFHTTVQALIIIGAILTFSVSSYENTTLSFFVNLSTLVVIPCVILCLIMSMLSNSIKITSYGKYLCTIEKKINKLLGYSNKPNAKAEDRIIDWERWRLYHGIAKNKIVFFDGFLLYVLLFISSITLVIHRLLYINRSFVSSLRIWVIVVPAFFSVFLYLCNKLIVELRNQRTSLSALAASEEIDYAAQSELSQNNKTKVGIAKSVLHVVLLFIILEIVLFSCVPFSFYSATATTTIITQAPIAHRGLFDSNHPENTLSAFQNAVDSGCAIELDIWFSKDGYPVVTHSDNVVGINGTTYNIEDVDLAELQTFCPEIPTVSLVLNNIDPQTLVLIDIKDNFASPDNCQVLYDLIKLRKDTVAIQSFSPLPLKWFKNNHPELVRGQLFGDWGALSFLYTLRSNLFNYISEPNFISCDRNTAEYGSWYLARKCGIPVVGWIFKLDELSSNSADLGFFDAYIVEK